MPGSTGGRGTQLRTWQFCKTKMCKFESMGICAKGNRCPFAHSSDELKPMPDLTCTKPCKTLIKTGMCDNPACTYAHSREELRPTSTFHKTKLCRFSQTGYCALGSKCNFAHSQQEIRGFEEQCGPLPQARVAEGGRQRPQRLGEVGHALRHQIAMASQPALDFGSGAAAADQPRYLPHPAPAVLPTHAAATVASRAWGRDGATGNRLGGDAAGGMPVPRVEREKEALLAATSHGPAADGADGADGAAGLAACGGGTLDVPPPPPPLLLADACGLDGRPAYVTLTPQGFETDGVAFLEAKRMAALLGRPQALAGAPGSGPQPGLGRSSAAGRGGFADDSWHQDGAERPAPPPCVEPPWLRGFSPFLFDDADAAGGQGGQGFRAWPGAASKVAPGLPVA